MSPSQEKGVQGDADTFNLQMSQIKRLWSQVTKITGRKKVGNLELKRQSNERGNMVDKT